ncbi:MAG: peptide chain release factor 3 [Chitinispirillia bacterium]|nr:peptide chain release factor 3 [Chitinispirillia bacterium]MCL2268020.1 peptide chain release factor 3 [Chitinispirillia bacterium]
MTTQKEISRRRTFAIVSHPDAGKTTLTEKLLLYGGALHLAGSVTARKKERATVSDWMELERKRGISVSSTVLNFDYGGYHVNLLDTPGHNDFSEDTYRVLTAVDSVIMVIDGGKGIENQTRKLFEVCRRRNTPVFTFVNKMDRPALGTLELLDEIERVLKIGAYPMNLPLGSGGDFRGILDRKTGQAHFYERTPGGTFRAPVATHGGLSDPVVKDALSPTVYAALCEEMEMVEHAGVSFSPDDVLAGRTTPVFFGSAANNFGVQLLLDGFLGYSPPPVARANAAGGTIPVTAAPAADSADIDNANTADNNLIDPNFETFSGFVFKIQANMDPRHRDRMAFVRIVSGKFTRGMTATLARTGKAIRLANSSNVFGRERTTVDEAYAGDVIGVMGTDSFRIGDTLSGAPGIVYDEIPSFPPECFAYIHNPSPANYKRFREGLTQLVQEGLVKLYDIPSGHQKISLLGAVGPLQFDLVQYRLESEYNAASRLEQTDWTIVKRIQTKDGAPADEKGLHIPMGAKMALDKDDCQVLLFPGDWHMNFFIEHNKEVTLAD